MSISCKNCAALSAGVCRKGLTVRPDAPITFADLLAGCDEMEVGTGSGHTGPL